MSENLICPGLRSYSKKGKENFDYIFRKKIKCFTNRECKKENCDLDNYLGSNCNCFYFIGDIGCCCI